MDGAVEARHPGPDVAGGAGEGQRHVDRPDRARDRLRPRHHLVEGREVGVAESCMPPTLSTGRRISARRITPDAADPVDHAAPEEGAARQIVEADDHRQPVVVIAEVSSK